MDQILSEDFAENREIFQLIENFEQAAVMSAEVYTKKTPPEFDSDGALLCSNC